MKVARSEAVLLAFVRAVFEGRGADPYLVAAHPLTVPISPTAMEILEHTLAVGCVRALTRSGWRNQKRPVGQELIEGRLWDRHTPQLHFSPWSFRILRSLLNLSLTVESCPVAPPEEPGDGDRILAFLLAGALHRSQLCLDCVAHEPLVQLAYLQGQTVPEPFWIEALEGELAERWLEELEALSSVSDPVELATRCLALDRTANTLLDAVPDRRDLADFILQAARNWIAEDPEWMPALTLNPDTPLRARMEARRAMIAVPGVVLRLAQGIHADGQVKFFEDGYDEAQERLAQWEAFGPKRVQAARNAIERLSE